MTALLQECSPCVLCRRVSDVLEIYGFPLPVYTETKECLPAEFTGLIGVNDELIGMGGVQLEGLQLQKVVEVLRQATKEKIGEPLSLRFRRCTRNTARTSTEVSQTVTRKESGAITREKQKDLVAVSNSKESVAQSSIPSLNAKPGEGKDTSPTFSEDTSATVVPVPDSMACDSRLQHSTEIVGSDMQAVKTALNNDGALAGLTVAHKDDDVCQKEHCDDDQDLCNGHNEYVAIMSPDPQFGIGLHLTASHIGTNNVAGFKKHPGK